MGAWRSLNLDHGKNASKDNDDFVYGTFRVDALHGHACGFFTVIEGVTMEKYTLLRKLNLYEKGKNNEMTFIWNTKYFFMGRASSPCPQVDSISVSNFSYPSACPHLPRCFCPQVPANLPPPQIARILVNSCLHTLREGHLGK